MPWFRVDDGLSSKAETTRIPRAHRRAAIGVWALAGSWSAKELTDGHIPAHMLEELAGTPDDANWLVAAGFWQVVEDGWQFVVWAPEQPLKVKVLRDRAKTAERVGNWRRDNKPDASNGVTNADTNDVSNRAPYPIPSQSQSHAEDPLGSSSPDAKRADVEALCEVLADLIEGNGSRRPTITKAWRDAARLLIDKDEHDVWEATELIRWCQADSFWKSNILSMPKFREKYDQLRLKRGAVNVVALARAPATTAAQKNLEVVRFFEQQEANS